MEPTPWVVMAVALTFTACKAQPASPPSVCWGTITTGSDRDCQGADEFEPNDNTSQANVLRPASASWQSVSGAIGNGIDVFTTTGPQPNSQRYPTAHIDSDPTALRLCLFVTCTVGKTGLDPKNPCPSGGIVYHLPEGMLGCCTPDGGREVQVNATCDAMSSPTTTIPEFRAQLVVDRTDQRSTCLPYKLAYRF